MMTGSLGRAALLACTLAVAVPLSQTVPTEARAAAPAAMLPSFSALVKETRPAVVTIRTATSNPASSPEVDPQMREFMERFFGRRFDAPQGRGGQPRALGIGSGFIIDRDGLIVTNNHVIEGGNDLTVVLTDGTEYQAELVGSDERTDLAVLRIDAGKALPTVAWGDSDTVEVGDWAIAIGNPFGLGGTVTAGIVSARGRDISSGPYDDYLQVDASINRGNSGGPLFDQQGRVIGVNTAIYSPSGGNVGIGFAIPANQARDVVEDLVRDGSVERGWLGVSIQTVSDEIAAAIGLDAPEGVLISEVVADGPADSSGLQRGDVIIRFGPTKIETLRDLTRTVAATDPNRRVDVQILRRGEPRTITVRTGRFPS